MKNLYILLAFLTFFVNGLFGQVIVPAANTNTGSVNDPLGTYWGFERSAMIYTSAQIGGTTGNITSVGFYVNSISTPGNAVNVRIYMKMRTTLMTANSTYGTEISGATLVYGPTTIPASSFVAGQWITIPLSTPFNYTGGTNHLEVIVETNATAAGNEGLTGKQFRYSSPGNSTSYQFWNADNNAPTGNGSRSANRPNIRLDFQTNTPPSCASTPTPANAATGVSTATTLSWPAVAGATGYDVFFGTSPTPPQVSTNQAGTTYNPGALSASTTYYWRVVPRNSLGSASGCNTWNFTTGLVGCLNVPNGLWPSDTYTPACNGSPEEITTNGWTGEYSNVNLTSGTQYTFSSSVSTDYITISNSTGTSILVSGTSPLTWTSNVTGTVRFILHNNISCATQNTSRTRFIQCGTPPPPPPNDLVCNATTITCGQTLNGTTINGTNSGTGESSTCGVSQVTNGVWYSFQGNGQMVMASLCGSTWDSRISVYSGSCSSLTCIGGNDDDGPGCVTSFSASYTFQSQVGVTYYIKVHGYSTNSAFSLALTCGGTATGTTSPGNVSACVFTSAPTSSTQTTACTYPYGVTIGGGTQVDRCFEFVATNSSLNWQMFNSTTCFWGGLVTPGTWSWVCYDVSNNLISSSTALTSPMLISNLVVGQTYRICYSFIHANGCSSSNFQPYVYGPSVLPVNLISFTSGCDGGIPLLKWTTASEQNSDYFQIERSRDGIDWISGSKVQAMGNSNTTKNYQFYDITNGGSFEGYYRLKQVDFDGQFKYFGPIYTNCFSNNLTSYNIEVFPNPTSNDLFIGIKNSIFGDGQIILMDLSGKVIKQDDVQLSDGYNLIKLDITGLVKGVYIIKMISNDMKFFEKIIKN